MYINFDLLFKAEMKSGDLLILLMIKQKEYERLEHHRERLLKLYEEGYVTTIKGKANTPKYMNARLSKKAVKFLGELEVPNITDEAIKLVEDLMGLVEDLGKNKPNKKKLTFLVNWFMAETGADAETIFSHVEEYISGWNVLENMFFKAKNAYTTKPNLAESYLYTLLEK